MASSAGRVRHLAGGAADHPPHHPQADRAGADEARDPPAPVAPAAEPAGRGCGRAGSGGRCGGAGRPPAAPRLMFSHIAVFRFKPGTTDQQVDAIERGLAGLPARLPEMRSYAYGRDLRIVEGNGDFAVVAEFDDEAAWLVYQKDEEHRRVIDQLIVPVT